MSSKNIAVPVLNLAFRPFFLLAAIFSVLAIGLWSFSLSAGWHFSPYGGGLWWHAHEMLLGFTTAVVVGFLLTAVQTWTGIPSVKGNTLLLLVLVWLLPRFLLAINPVGMSWAIAGLDMLFLPLAAYFLARPIIKIKQYRNLVFIPVLLLMALANAYMHWSVFSQDASAVMHGSRTMVWLVLLLMCIIGGRVFPMFTANGTGTQKVLPIFPLEVFCIGSVAVMALLTCFNIALPNEVMAACMAAMATGHFARWLRWRFWITWRVPLLWSLHLSYFCIPLGFAMYAANYWLGVLSSSIALHTITVGAIGMMILSMISRVSLGHTGRKIVVGKTMCFAFLIFVLAFLSRVFMPMLGGSYGNALLISGLCWMIAYGVFFVMYFKVLTQPRVDGKPG